MVRLALLALCLLILPLVFDISTAEAQDLVYHLGHEWADILINQDGTIDLLYDITILCDHGTLHYVEIGQPNGDFTIGYAFDEFNDELQVVDTSSGSRYKVRVDVKDLNTGEGVRFNLTTNVGKMIWEDLQNPGNVGMRFTPSWFDAPVNDLRVRIVMPSGVNVTDVKTMTDYWDNVGHMNGQLWVYWERSDLAPGEGEEYEFGVSFPKIFVDSYEIPQNFVQTYGLWIVVVVVVLSLLVLIVVLIVRKTPYIKPILSMETLGIRRGLMAVEASYLLELKPNMIVTEILYSLLKKRAVWVTDAKPPVKIEMMPRFETKTPSELAEASLRYYEIDFLRAIKEDGTLEEESLAETIKFLSHSVEDKLRGYCRRDTVEYYWKIVDKAWEQVRQAKTSELASNLYDEQLLWLLLDPQRQEKTETAFTNRVFEPSPLWLWYWYSYQHFHPRPTYKPDIDTPSKTGSAPKIPGADFANNIATAVENTSAGIVANLEKFANAIVPPSPPSKTSHKPANPRSNCVCACAACACACACVSCACACAGGGAG